MTAEFALDGAAAPPMLNGELVFDAPWQGRAFGIARGMAEQGVYAWDDFRDRLIAEIGAFDRHAEDVVRRGGAAPAFHYYDHFLRALETLLVERRLLAGSELRGRVHAFEARPHGHDHTHAHDDQEHARVHGDHRHEHHGHSRDHAHGHSHDRDTGADHDQNR